MQSATLKQLLWSGIFLFLVTFILILAAPSHAQTTTGTISGTVTNEDGGAPLADLQVVVYTTNFSTAEYACTAADGSYTINNLPLNTTLFAKMTPYGCGSISRSPYAPEYYNNAAILADATPLQLTAGDPDLTGIDFELETGAVISGTVYNEDHTATLTGIAISAYTLNGEWSSYTCNNADGTYTLVGVAYSADLYVTAGSVGCGEPQSYFTEWWQESAQQSGANAFNFSPIFNPVAGAVDFTLAQTGVITGFVYDENNDPLPNMPINYQIGSTSYIGVVCSTGDGSYRLPGLPRDTQIYVSAGGNAMNCGGSFRPQEWWQAAETLAAAQPLTLTVGALTATNINFILETSSILPPEFTRVLTPSNVTFSEISTLTVTLENPNDITLNSVSVSENLPVGLAVDYTSYPSTNCTGYIFPFGSGYSLSNVTLAPSESCTYTISLKSYTPGTYPLGLTGANVMTLETGSLQPTVFNEVTLTVDGEMGSISGTTTDATTSEPVANTYVYVYTPNYGFSASTCTDASGNYQLDNIPHGISLIIMNTGYDCPNMQPTIYLQEWWQEAETSISATPITLSAALPNASNIDFTILEGGTISGTVYQADGVTPLAGIAVSANTPVGSSSAFTDSNGQYTLQRLPYNTPLAVQAGGMQQTTGINYYPEYWDHSFLYANATMIEVTLAAPARTGIDFALSPGGIVFGQVTQDGNPLPMTLVEALIDGQPVNGGCTSSDGSYAVGYLPQNYPVYLRTSTTGCLNQPQLVEYWQEASTLETATSVTLTSISQHGINFTLDTPTARGTISGVVYAADNVTPLSNITVTATLPAVVSNIALTTTNSAGEYTLGGLPLNTDLIVKAQDDNGGYYPQYWAYAPSEAAATAIQITQVIPAQANINFALNPAGVATHGTFTGTVYAADNVTPLSNITVTAILPASASTIAMTTTNSAGQYTLIALPMNTDLLVKADGSTYGYQTQYWAYAPSAATATPIQATSAWWYRTDINFALNSSSNPTGTISGIVYAADNVTPLSNITVTATIPPMASNIALTTSNASGEYTLSGLPLNTDLIVKTQGNGVYQTQYWAYVSSPEAASAIQVTEASPLRDNINFALSSGGTIYGHVTANGNPVYRAKVELLVNGLVYGSGCTAGDGSYGISFLATPMFLQVRTADTNCDNAPQMVEYWMEASSPANAGSLTPGSGLFTGVNFTLDSTPPPPVIFTRSFTPDNLSFGQVTVMTVTMSNPNNFPVTGVALSESLPAGLMPLMGSANTNTCGSQPFIMPAFTSYSINGTVIPANGTCTYTIQFVSHIQNTYTLNNYPTFFTSNETGDLQLNLPIATVTFGGQAGTISGTTTDSSGNPVSVALQARVVGSPYTVNMNSDSNGQYTLTDIPVGVPVTVGIPFAAPYLHEWWENASTEASATPITLASTSLTGLDFVLELGGTISGTIYESDEVTPIPGLVVFADVDNPPLYISANTDSNGQYTLMGLPYNADIIVRVGGYSGINNTFYNGEYWNDVLLESMATPLQVALATPNLTDIDFDMNRYGVFTVGQIGGVVTEEGTGTPIANMRVDISNGQTGCTDANGHYVVNDVPFGNYYVNVQAYCNGDPAPYLAEWWYEAASQVGASTAQLSTMLPAQDVNFTLTPNTIHAISGIVYFPDGVTPASNIPVTGTVAGSWTNSTVTDANGHYTLTDVPLDVNVLVVAGGSSSQFALQYWQNAYTVASATPIVVTSVTPQVSGIDFVTDWAGVINGRLYNASAGNAPIINAQVDLLINGEVLASTCSDAAGYFTANGIPFGETVYARAAASQTACGGGDPLYIEEYWQEAVTQATATPIVLISSPTYIEFTLLPRPTTGTIYGTIKGVSAAGSVPLLNAKVEIYNSDMSFTGAVCTDDSGNFNQSTLPFGISFFVKVTQYCDGTPLSPYLETWWDGSLYGTQNSTNAVSIMPTADASTHQVNLLLPRIDSITGRITHAGTGAPLAGVPLEAVFIDNHVISRACSSASGDYILSAILLNQNVYVRVATTGNCAITPAAEQWWQNAATLAEATPIVLTAAERYRAFIDFTVDVTVEPPTAPTIIAPMGVINASTPDYVWTKVANAATYRLYIQDAYGQVLYDQAGLTNCDATTCTHLPIVLLADGMSYRAWVQAINVAGSAWSEASDFTSIWSSTPPVAPVVTAPAGTISDAQPLYQWMETSGATQYRVYVSDGLGAVVVDQTYTDLGAICVSGTCSAEPAISLIDGTYSVWVQAGNASGSAWSDAQVFTLSTITAPTMPTLNAPSGVIYQAAPTFSWTESSGATHYRLYVSSDLGTVMIDETQPAASVCNSGFCNYAPGVSLPVNAGYTGWVQALNNVGSAWSGGVSFYIGVTPPAAATLTAPGAITTDTTPLYTWNEVSGATSYRLYVSDAYGAIITDTVFASDICTAGVCVIDPGATLSVGNYTAWVLTSNSGGNGPWSAPLNFYVVESAPPAPILITPNGVGTATQPIYQWNESAGATQYRLYVQDVYGVVVTDEVVTSSVCSGGVCSYTPAPMLTIGTSYTWWVLAANSGGGAWSSALSFVPGNPPGTTTITAPVSPTSETQPTYGWTEVSGATVYRLYIALGSGQVLFDQVVAATCNVGTCTFSPVLPLTPGESYQVWVLAGNALGYGGWAGPYYFSVNP